MGNGPEALLFFAANLADHCAHDPAVSLPIDVGGRWSGADGPQLRHVRGCVANGQATITRMRFLQPNKSEH
jgi:hypothetical protein